MWTYRRYGSGGLVGVAFFDNKNFPWVGSSECLVFKLGVWCSWRGFLGLY